MLSPIRKISLLSFITLFPISVTAQPIASLFEAPQKAEQFNYCDWQFQQNADTTGLHLATTVLNTEEATTVAQRASAVLIDAGVKIAGAAKNEKSCRKAFSKGAQKYDRTFSKNLKKLSKKDKIKWSEDEAIADIQKKISALWAEDQARRIAYSSHNMDREIGAPLWTSALSRTYGAQIDHTSTAYMKEVLEKYDWVDIHRFGGRISAHAWLLVQHADRDPAFQALALERMTPYLENNGVSKSNYAYLFDRVAVNHDRKQRYGTQPIWECTDNGLELAPLEEPETVNERRAAFGMDTVESSLAAMSRSVCGK